MVVDCHIQVFLGFSSHMSQNQGMLELDTVAEDRSNIMTVSVGILTAFCYKSTFRTAPTRIESQNRLIIFEIA